MSATPKQMRPVSREISSKYLPMSFFSWMNLTLASTSAVGHGVRSAVPAPGKEGGHPRAKKKKKPLTGELDGLVEAVFAAVRNVDDLDDLGLEALACNRGQGHTHTP